ncbi:hypothetical protein AMTRI_Chr01g109190 [Amborella trichopoda]|uniref:BTB domain-containing protein n=1 Tax=Amborella trichopoda TaxID=13333 RepID=W1PAU5_AMBTC|nr:regulatory protein NPR5 [Amborella trichopoda]ERN05068.1 hypothetical protein AMTR_s00053p00115370 [Amborella trichopoda]|eukprot:XP_006843393.1 regulatory protein NPR5 [Amborella trichopoda]
MSLEDSMKVLSLDYLNLLINGQAFSDVTFSVEGRHIHAHKCILAARSSFFRRFFCDQNQNQNTAQNPNQALSPITTSSPPHHSSVVQVTVVGYEVFLLLLQFLYSGQVSITPQKHEARPNCPERSCWHTHCSSAIDLALDTLAAAHFFGVDQLSLLTQAHLASIVDKASIEDVMRVLLACSHNKPLMHPLWSTCSRLVAQSGLPLDVLAKHLPPDLAQHILDMRLESNSANARAHVVEDHKVRRMQRALDSSDVELVKLMVMGEGLNLDDALALHYAVARCSREVVKALLELGAADVNHAAGPAGRTPLHIAAEMVSPDMVAVLLDHHADPNARSASGATPFDVLQSLASDFLFKGPNVSSPTAPAPHIEHNKLRLCLELLQSAALVISRGCDGAEGCSPTPPQDIDSRMLFLNIGGKDRDGGGGSDGSGYCGRSIGQGSTREF